MIPAYSKAAEHFKSTSNTRIAKVDATIHKDLGSKFGVKGFPTLKFF
jgi:protein disulfide-isomerase A6